MRGGKRPGAGRKKGERNPRTLAMLARAEAAGLLPHEFLAAVARGEEFQGHTPTFQERIDAAKAAAPFYAPRLNSLDNKLSGNVGTYQAIPVAEREPLDTVDAPAGPANGSDPPAYRH